MTRRMQAVGFAAVGVLTGCADNRNVPTHTDSACLAPLVSPPVDYVAKRGGPGDLGSIMGLTIDRRLIYTLDLQEGSVRVIDADDGVQSRQFGRTGNGPGEFQSFAAAQALRTFPSLWMDIRDDSVFTFDGRRIDTWVEGVSVRSRSLPLGMATALTRVSALRSLDDRLLLGIERSPNLRSDPDAPGSLVLTDVGRGETTETFRLEFATLPWPRDEAGRLARGLAEAKPSWDALGRCVVFHDGHSNAFILASTESSHRDTLRVELPDRFAADAEAGTYRTLGVRNSAPATRHAARVHAITLDPSGTVWLLPARADYAGEVWKVDLRSGRVSLDTSTAFPLRFERGGHGVGISYEETGLGQAYIFSPASMPDRPKPEK